SISASYFPVSGDCTPRLTASLFLPEVHMAATGPGRYMAGLTVWASRPAISTACRVSERRLSVGALTSSCQPDPQPECSAARLLPQPLKTTAGEETSFW